MKIRILFFLLLFTKVVLSQAQSIVLLDTTQRVEWFKGTYFIHYDTINAKSFSEIRALATEGKFKIARTNATMVHSFNEELWAKIEVLNKGTHDKDYLIELYDFHIDNYDIYVLKADSILYHYIGGDLYPFDQRRIKHKNFLNVIKTKPNTNYTIFIRIKSKQAIGVFGALRTYSDLVYYSNKEYTLLSIFYGFLLLMSLYCLIVYLVILKKTYLYFVLNVFSVALYSLSNDGLGFQYIWSDWVIWNEYVQSFSVAMFTITSLLFSSEFLKIAKLSRIYYKGIQILLVLRILSFSLGYFLYEPFLYMYQFDIVILLYIFFIAIYSYSKNYLPARFFIMAYAFLFVGFTLNILMILGYANNTLFAVYALNFGTIFQLFIFSFALADQVQMVISKTRITQLNLINQLKENDQLKDKVTKELEDRVKERTQELEFKNQQLDAFVYKASHDIKGPLKSIIGLAKLGIVDIHDPNAREYFQHIEKSSKRLDTLVSDLLQVSKINNTLIQATMIDFESLIGEVKSSLMNLPDFDTFEIELQVKQDRDFYADGTMIYSIFQNLIENAFTYRDKTKEKSIMKIRIEIDKQKTLLEFNDNGIGINKDLKDKVFDMFYRASDISGGSGLGLYLVKMAVNKIGGRISMESKMKKGTTFTIVI